MIWEKQERGKQTGNIYGNDGCKSMKTKLKSICSVL